MADIRITSDVAAVAEAMSRIVCAVIEGNTSKRQTASLEAREQYDRIEAQMYWDFRAFLQAVGIVGEPQPWPPKQ